MGIAVVGVNFEYIFESIGRAVSIIFQIYQGYKVWQRKLVGKNGVI